MRITFAAFLFLLFTRLHAQTTAAYTILSANEGLSQGMVFKILQSKDDFLWIATKDGLNRYDGYRFEIFSPDPFDPFAIAGSELRYLHEDKRGWLWVCYGGGIDVFMPETGRFYHLPIGQEFTGYAFSIQETPDHSIWVGCIGFIWKMGNMESVLKKAAAADQPFPDFTYTKFQVPATRQREEFISLYLAQDQSLLASSKSALYRIDPVSGKLHSQPEFLGSDSLCIIGEDVSGRLWLNSKHAVWVQKNKGAQPLKFNIPTEKGWIFDPEGNFWNIQVNTLQKWNPDVLAAGGAPAQELVLSANFQKEVYYLTGVMIDRSGNAWVGTSGYGLFKFVTAKPKFSSYMPLTSHRTFVEDPNGRLISLMFPRQIHNGKQFDHPMLNPWFEKVPPGKQVGSVQFDQRGNCWTILHDKTLCRIDAQTKDATLFEGAGVDIFYNKKGKFLSLGEDALIEFDPATQQFTKHPFDKPLSLNYYSQQNSNIYEDSQRILWICAYEGLLKATPTATGYRFERFVNNPADRSTLSNNLVFTVAEDPREPHRYLWVGTKGGGLNRLDRQTGKFIHIKTEQGLPDNVIYGILPDRGGNLWLSTNKGLCRMSVDSASSVPRSPSPVYRFKNFTAADGLQSNEFNQGSFFKTKDGTMIFGGVNGVTVFHPDSLRLNERKPRTVITRLSVNNEKMDIGILGYSDIKSHRSNISISQYPNIQLSHHQNLLAFEFAALDFTNPAQNQYRYQLVRERTFGKNEGENWVELGSKNTVQFANLQPGSYTLKVLGSNNDGIWSETPATLEFEIRPPWWATWWAYLLYALVTGGGVWLFYRRQLRQRLEHQETLRLRELDDFKNRLFTNITHEFRTPLTVILGNLEMEKLEIGKLGKPENDRIAQFLNFLISKNTLSRRNAESLLRLINQILDLAKLESNTLKLNYVQGDVLPYLRYISESLHSFANAQNVMLRVESKEPEIVMDYDPERLLQIVHNLLSNAIKFTPSGGKVLLRATSDLAGFQNLPSLNLSVCDTGAGIPTEDLPKIFDRFFQANNLEKAKAGGTGIGLSLTKELVKAMSGEISVESEVGKGTTFTVRLPISNKAMVTDATNAPSRRDDIFVEPASRLGSRSVRTVLGEAQHTVPTERESSLETISTNMPSLRDDVAKAQILLIEDNPDVVEYLAACLQENYTLDFAYNGRAGIEKALQTVPDLIISDVMMPEKDGFEVCDTLKNDERTSHVPIVLLTAKADVQSRIAGLRRGADAYLLKPFHQEELLVTLSNLLELRRKLQLKYQAAAFEPAPLSFPIHLFGKGTSPDFEDAFLQKIKTAVESRLSDGNLSVEDICRMVGMSHPVIHRKITALTGRSLTLFVRNIRLARAKELLSQPDLTISDVAYQTGFNDPKFFSRVFSEEFGMSPTVFRQQS